MSLPFSFVIVAKNESLMLSKCLESILSQNYNKELVDVILVDDYSTDDTQNIARKYGAIVITPDLPPNKTTRAHNKNLAVKFCKGDYIIFLDAHMVIPSMNWLTSLENYIVSNNLDLISGPVIPPPHLMPVLNHLPLAKLKDIFLSMPETATAFNGGNMAISRKLMETLGGFPNLSASEDIALYRNAMKQGINCKVVDGLYLYHLDHRLASIKSWLKRSVKESFYAHAFSRSHIKFDKREKYVYSVIVLSVLASIFMATPVIILTIMPLLYLGVLAVWLRRMFYVARQLSNRVSIKDGFTVSFFGSTQAFIMLFSGFAGTTVYLLSKLRNIFSRKH
ncbi:glycosyltransferase [bacterium]|nr:MAG: glycosyltransferase [bacterium]